MTFFSRILPTPRRDTGDGSVHFHAGPQGQPSPCFDERCPSPRLDPEAR